MIRRIARIIGSLRLTVVCLALALILVFAGTLAQVRLGLYATQAQFFHSFFVYWTLPGTALKVPVLPGGWLLGVVLLVNLLAAHILRFQLTARKAGLLLVHAGLIFLLLGQFFTEMLQTESTMRLEIGETKNYSEDSRRDELAVIDVTDPGQDRVAAIPQALLEKGGDVRLPGLPFALRVKTYFSNSLPAGPMSGPGAKLQAADGIGRRLLFTAAPVTARLDDENKPAALVEVLTAQGSAGTWTVSTWLTRRPWSSILQQQFGALLGGAVEARQVFTVGGRTYQLALRPVRYYKPCAITLVEFKHDVYAGTDIPSNFSSKIHLYDPARGEDRDVVIRMNSPLRYRGEAYYQASFEPGDRVSILQVVRNPTSLTPYIACSMIATGLVAQFLTHLFGFARKRARQTTAGLAAAALRGGCAAPGPIIRAPERIPS
ncbi:MAG: cytochrome c biogenesis protein ResB [Verrucomicrobiota bacterium]|jgi:hypothetical protein